MVLSKLPGPPYLDYSKTRAYFACSRCGWGCLDIFFSLLSFLFLPLSARRADID